MTEPTITPSGDEPEGTPREDEEVDESVPEYPAGTPLESELPEDAAPGEGADRGQRGDSEEERGET